MCFYWIRGSFITQKYSGQKSDATSGPGGALKSAQISSCGTLSPGDWSGGGNTLGDPPVVKGGMENHEFMDEFPIQNLYL